MLAVLFIAGLTALLTWDRLHNPADVALLPLDVVNHKTDAHSYATAELRTEIASWLTVVDLGFA